MPKHPGGRPTIYSTKMLSLAEKYLESCEDTEIEDEVNEYLEPQAHGGALQRAKKNNIVVKIPTMGGMARYLQVARSTLYDWAKEHKEFAYIMEQLGSEQEDRLINKGLSGDYNPTISKVLLTKHGYREGIDNTTNDKDLPAPLLNALRNNDSNKESSKPE